MSLKMSHLKYQSDLKKTFSVADYNVVQSETATTFSSSFRCHFPTRFRATEQYEQSPSNLLFCGKRKSLAVNVMVK